MKVELSVYERLWLLNNAVPKKSSVENLRIAQELIGILGISADERKTLNFRTEATDGGNERVVWDDTVEPVELTLSTAQIGLLLEPMDALSESGDFPIEILPLYDKLKGEG